MGKTRLIDPLMFSLAMRYVTQVGELDFLVPGCESLKKGGPRSYEAETSLDIERFEKNMGKVFKELLMGQQVYQLSYVEVGRAAREAARRLVTYGLYIATEQADKRLKEMRDAPQRNGQVSEI